MTHDVLDDVALEPVGEAWYVGGRLGRSRLSRGGVGGTVGVVGEVGGFLCHAEFFAFAGCLLAPHLDFHLAHLCLVVVLLGEVDISHGLRLAELQALCHSAHQDGIGDGVGNERHAVADVLRHLRHGIGVEGIDILHQGTDLEGDEVLHIRLEVRLRLFAGMLPAERVGVLAFGQGENAHIHALEQQEVDALDGCRDAGIVGVEHQDTVAGEALDDADVLGGEGGARCGDDVLEACLRHAEHIDIAFDDVAEVLPRHLVLGFEQAIGEVRLVIDGGFGRIDVLLEGMIDALQDSTAECNALAGEGMMGEDDTPGKPTDGCLVRIVAIAEPDTGPVEQVLALVAALQGTGRQVGLVLERIAQVIAMDSGILDASFAEVGETYIAALGRVEQVFLEALLRKLVEIEHSLAVGLLLALLVVHLLLFDLDAVFLAEPANGLVEGHLLLLHQEGDGRPAFAAGEALADVLGGRNVEGRRLVGVEGAQTDIVDPAAPQRHEIGNDIDDLSCVDDLVDGLLINHCS